MIISLLVAMDESRGIGKAGKLPWRLSADMKRFRELTMGHHIIVGRKTFESIGKPLPARDMIVVTREESLKPDGCMTARSVEAAIALAEDRGETEVFVCGGTAIYAQALNAAHRIYLTQVHANVDADTFFPEFDASIWRETEKSFQQADEKNQYALTFKVLERNDQ
ncbi:MAG TPA: dihydrofolate reductase [Blastocatellia bacterium]|nr:dihydrofolate reductase [Blastocatellia bacterium]